MAIVLLIGFAAPGAPPAQAQIMKQSGMAVPAFFFSGVERRAREACAEEHSDCRASVKAQMDFEKQISMTFPWILLVVAIIGVMIVLRRQEAKKAKARQLARAHHDPGAFRKLDREKETKRSGDNDDDEDLS